VLSGLPWVVSQPAATARRFGNRLNGLVDFLRSGLQAGMEAPLNEPIGAHRRVAFVDFALAEVKAVKAALGGTVNDIVLATVHGAVRRLLARRGGMAASGEFRVAVPMNTFDAAGRRGRLGNHVWAWIIDLPVRESNPVRALKLIGEQTRRLKETTQASGGAIITEAVEWTTARLVPLGARLVNRAQPNLVVTNVPGPPLPLFVLDAPVEAIYPHVPLFERQGLGVALFSYAGRLFWGLTGDWDALSDIETVARDIRTSFEALVAAAAARAQPSTTTQEAPKRAPRRGLAHSARANGGAAKRSAKGARPD